MPAKHLDAIEYERSKTMTYLNDKIANQLRHSTSNGDWFTQKAFISDITVS